MHRRTNAVSTNFGTHIVRIKCEPFEVLWRVKTCPQARTCSWRASTQTDRSMQPELDLGDYVLHSWKLYSSFRSLLIDASSLLLLQLSSSISVLCAVICSTLMLQSVLTSSIGQAFEVAEWAQAEWNSRVFRPVLPSVVPLAAHVPVHYAVRFARFLAPNPLLYPNVRNVAIRYELVNSFHISSSC